MSFRILALTLLLVLPAHAADLVTRPGAVGHRDFKRAKQVLPRVYAGLEQTLYCGCRYEGKRIDFSSCDYRVRKDERRGSRQEWEHVVPAWNIGHQRQCWKQGGRKHCTATDPVFRKAEGDLVNLVPEIGEINADRSNFRYGVWVDDPVPMYGQCKTVVDFRQRRIQPRQAVRGRIARIQMYMAATYGLRLSPLERRIFCTWARAYPVDAWERERERRIVRIQGTGNRFVTDPGLREKFCAPA
ncbi:MAG: endonuclease [Pigmentiphaga sp.]|uniref:endonuclease n=1 Tax=Pigmentiphaga sp. TaxID=1977564 RepID=UPI0029ADC8D3|nr:endonuclease [Pigmentiphaga sp.]MDX3905251.1 endonuclease [Pigmentiphaga sp.]